MIYIYTGDGKGKSTAALGLALRSLGAQKKVAILQFMKKGTSSEFSSIDEFKLPIDHFHFGVGFYKILGDKRSKGEHCDINQRAMKKACELIGSKKYDLIILDEINVALKLDLIKIDDVLAMISKYRKNDKIDIVLTGRGAPKKLKNVADLISTIKNERHYFDKGSTARRGIEY